MANCHKPRLLIWHRTAALGASESFGNPFGTAALHPPPCSLLQLGARSHLFCCMVLKSTCMGRTSKVLCTPETQDAQFTMYKSPFMCSGVTKSVWKFYGCIGDFLRGVTEGGGGFHTPVRGTMFVRNGAVTPGPSHECDITFFVKGRPKSARQSRDSTLAVRRVQSVTVPSSRVSRECRSPGLRSPLFKMPEVFL